MAEELKVEIRKTLGKRNTRRLRKTGVVPAVLYGHGEETLSLSVPGSQLGVLVNQGSRLVALTGAIDESAFIRTVQWNTWGTEVLHVDFTRVSADEKVTVVVAIELRGEAPGVREGGVVEHLLHEIEIECPAMGIPEKLEVNINHLGLDESIKVAELQLPEGATASADPATIITQCIMPMEELEEEEGAVAGEGEPEVIGAKEEEEGKG